MANSFFGRSTPLRIHSVYTYGRPYAQRRWVYAYGRTWYDILLTYL